MGCGLETDRLFQSEPEPGLRRNVNPLTLGRDFRYCSGASACSSADGRALAATRDFAGFLIVDQGDNRVDPARKQRVAVRIHYGLVQGGSECLTHLIALRI